MPFQLMAFAPIYFPGESIPIRLFLAGYEMTPTMRDINKKFSVRYYLNLVLIDEEERRYFKQQVHYCIHTSLSNEVRVQSDNIPVRSQQEITLWRKGDIVRRSMSQQATIAAQRYEGSNPEPTSAQAKEETD